MRPLDLARYPEAVHLIGAPPPPPDGTPYERPRAGREKEGGKEGEGKTGKEKEGEGKEGGECGREVRALLTTIPFFSAYLWTSTLSPFTSAPFPPLGPSQANDAIPGYMPLRGDFDVEHDNEVLSLSSLPASHPSDSTHPPFLPVLGYRPSSFWQRWRSCRMRTRRRNSSSSWSWTSSTGTSSALPPRAVSILSPSYWLHGIRGWSFFVFLRSTCFCPFKSPYFPPFRPLPLPFFSPGNWMSERNARRS